jgi:hypothetical protein
LKPTFEVLRRKRLSPAHGALALTPAAMLCVLLLRSVWDVDIFWQLRLGDLILDARGPVRLEPFSAPHFGEPLAGLAWLGQATFALMRRIGGWTGLRLFDALCWCGGFWLLAASVWRRGASAGSVALALILAFVAALPAASIRPQSFGALAFGALLALLKLRRPAWQTVAAGVPLLVLWQNLHPSVGIGAVALAAHAAGGWAAWLRGRSSPRPWAATILAPLALVSMFATPDGAEVLAVSARNAQASVAVGASEWLPLWIPANHGNAVPILMAALVALLAVLRGVLRAPGRLDWSDLAVMAALLVMTVAAYRFALFWAIATIPVIAMGSPAGRRNSAAVAPLAGNALLLVAVLTPWLRPTHFSDNLPLAAVARLQATGVQGTVFTEPEFAGVLIDSGYPRWRVTLDGRYYRYSDEEWGRYGAILAGTFRLRQVEWFYRPAAFVLRPSHTTALCNELDRPGSGWRRIYRDEGAAVWVPQGAVTRLGKPGSARR